MSATLSGEKMLKPTPNTSTGAVFASVRTISAMPPPQGPSPARGAGMCGRHSCCPLICVTSPLPPPPPQHRASHQEATLQHPQNGRNQLEGVQSFSAEGVGSKPLLTAGSGKVRTRHQYWSLFNQRKMPVTDPKLPQKKQEVRKTPSRAWEKAHRVAILQGPGDGSLVRTDALTYRAAHGRRNGLAQDLQALAGIWVWGPRPS